MGPSDAHATVYPQPAPGSGRVQAYPELLVQLAVVTVQSRGLDLLLLHAQGDTHCQGHVKPVQFWQAFCASSSTDLTQTPVQTRLKHISCGEIPHQCRYNLLQNTSRNQPSAPAIDTESPALTYMKAVFDVGQLLVELI